MVSSLLYLGGIDLPMRQARAVQSLHSAHALAVQGCRVTLAVGRAPRCGLGRVFADCGLAPHPRLSVLALPTLRLPPLAIPSYVHPRLAAWNWSYGLATLVAVLLMPRSQRPDLVLARDPRLASLFIRAREITGAEVVYEVHELFSTRAREPVAGPAVRAPNRTPHVRRLEEGVFRRAVGCITLTRACRDLLIEDFGVAPERVLVAPDAVASVPPQLPPRQAASRTIVYAGQLYPWKGVSTVVQALSDLPDASLRIVGGLENGDGHTRTLVKLAEERGVMGRVRFAGYLPHAEVAAVVQEAAVAVVPLPDNPMSRYFTSPLKVFEYMAAGLPIVASDLPALREVLEHDRNALLVPPGDPAALAAALRRLLDDRHLAERLRAQALADVANRTWANRARNVLAFVNSLNGNGRRAGRGGTGRSRD